MNFGLHQSAWSFFGEGALKCFPREIPDAAESAHKVLMNAEQGRNIWPVDDVNDHGSSDIQHLFLQT